MCHLAEAAPLIPLRSLYPTTPEVRCDPWVDAPCLIRAAGGLLKEHSNRPVFPVKIGPVSLKPTRRHTHNTHTSLHWLCAQAPQSPALQVMSSPLCLALAPHSSHFHPLAQIWSHLLHNHINILVSCMPRLPFLFFSWYSSVVSPR